MELSEGEEFCIWLVWSVPRTTARQKHLVFFERCLPERCGSLTAFYFLCGLKPVIRANTVLLIYKGGLEFFDGCQYWLSRFGFVFCVHCNALVFCFSSV